MFIRECRNSKEWEEFINKNQNFNFLQSYWWGQVLKKEGKDIEYWQLYGNKKDEVQGVALVERKKGAREKFTYLESLWGPVWLPSLSSFEITSILEDFCHYLSENRDDVFWRLSPPTGVLISTSDLEANVACKFFPSLARTRPPRKTSIIYLTETNEQILGKMKSKTRYNIKLAGRKNLKVTWGSKLTDLKKFWELLRATARRGKFRPHPIRHYKHLLKTKSSHVVAKVEIGIAHYENKPIAAVVLLFFNKTVYYLHGASSDEHKNFMAPHLLHWEAIKKAKKENCEVYDFWGVDSGMWPGVTRFKEGFGGEEIEYPDLYELPIKPYKYRAYRLYGRVRR